LPIKFQFASGSTEFYSTPLLDWQFSLWIDSIGNYLASEPGSCIRIVGHSSRSGKETYNSTLSEQRAAAIFKKLRKYDRELKSELVGMGSSQCIRCSEPDSPANAIDRRVELAINGCTPTEASGG
jgi:outer membrane protein OmpA-like peptidoglycan-associated protein